MIGSGYTITADPQNATFLRWMASQPNFTDNDDVVATDGLYQTADAAPTHRLQLVVDGASISQNNVS